MTTKEQKEYSNKLWICSAIYWDKEGKRIGWFPIPEGSSYNQRDQVAKDNGCGDWHTCVIHHHIRSFDKGSAQGQVKGDRDNWHSISLIGGSVLPPKEDVLTGSEAVFGFCSWLTTRK